MTAPYQGACSPWADLIDLAECCSSAADDALKERALTVATDVLFEKTGRRFPGNCEKTVRPCAQTRGEQLPFIPPTDASVNYGTLITGASWYGACSCNRSQRCGCTRLSEIRLADVVSEVTQVRVDGVILDPSLYRVDDWKMLVRLPDADGTNAGWPCCQRLELDATENETFEVTFTHGALPPAPLVQAAMELACQIVLGCEGSDECKLPQRVTSVTRQGVSFTLLDPQTFLTQGRTGLYSVDLAIATYNPKGIQRRASAISPDVPRPWRRTNT